MKLRLEEIEGWVHQFDDELHRFESSVDEAIAERSLFLPSACIKV